MHDAAVSIACEPDGVLSIDDEIVRIGPGVDLIALELATHGIERRDIVPHLANEPNAPLLIDEWVARRGPLPRHLPLLHRVRVDVEGAGERHSLPGDSVRRTKCQSESDCELAHGRPPVRALVRNTQPM